MRRGRGKRQLQVLEILQRPDVEYATTLQLTCMIFGIPLTRDSRPRHIRPQYEAVRHAVQQLAQYGRIEFVEDRVSLDGSELWRLVPRSGPRVVHLREVS